MTCPHWSRKSPILRRYLAKKKKQGKRGQASPVLLFSALIFGECRFGVRPPSGVRVLARAWPGDRFFCPCLNGRLLGCRPNGRLFDCRPPRRIFGFRPNGQLFDLWFGFRKKIGKRIVLPPVRPRRAHQIFFFFFPDVSGK